MTRVILNGTVKGLRGKTGNVIYRQLPDGTTIMTRAQPKMNSRQKKRAKERRSAAQKEHNSRFREAAFYARAAANAKPVYAERAALTPMRTAYNHAMYDWFHPPQIRCLAQDDGRILVEATDDVLVTSVRVTILDGGGGVLSAGDAVREEGDWWSFLSPAVGKTVIAEARDLPGNVTKLVLDV
jgi:hypothetical protein